MRDSKRIARYMKPLEGVPVASTLGVPYQDGRFWVVRIICPDGRTRVFRSGPPSRATARKDLSPRTRFAVMTRDQYRCVYCGASAPDVRLHVDHLVPLSRGGTNDPDNLLTACQPCNSGKSDSELYIVE